MSSAPNPNLYVETSLNHIRFIGCMLILTAATLIYLLITLWPSSEMMTSGKTEIIAVVSPAVTASAAVAAPGVSVASQAQEGKSAASPAKAFKGINIEQRLLVLVMIAGALGRFIHIATSFAEFAGNRQFEVGWIWWYLLKPFLGAALAVIFYLVLRGGLMTQAGSEGAVNLYGVVAMGGMVGMFSKQATAKLAEVFDTLFKTTPKSKPAPAQDAAVPAEAADASDLHDTASGAKPNPPVTPDHELPPASGGVASEVKAEAGAVK
jgi:hypothetical protein